MFTSVHNGGRSLMNCFVVAVAFLVGSVGVVRYGHRTPNENGGSLHQVARRQHGLLQQRPR
jgi:hypothetical protein